MRKGEEKRVSRGRVRELLVRREKTRKFLCFFFLGFKIKSYKIDVLTLLNHVFTKLFHVKKNSINKILHILYYIYN